MRFNTFSLNMQKNPLIMQYRYDLLKTPKIQNSDGINCEVMGKENLAASAIYRIPQYTSMTDLKSGKRICQQLHG